MHRSVTRSGIWLVLSLLFPLFCAANLCAAEFRYGIDELDAGAYKELAGKRAGVITNAAALSSTGEPSYLVLLNRGIDLKFLMAPEHGFSLEGQAGEKVDNSSVAGTLKVYSLYGSSKKPDPALLKTIDLLFFDLQDAGIRCYTYISTMKLAMEACRDAGITFVVLDRPNPIAPIPADGFMLEPSLQSFVGADELPFVHGMTVGEIALWMQKRHYPGLSLKVVKMQGYSRSRFADELPGFRFRSPSPNLRDFETLLLYPATVMLEATAVSEGRGTDNPFRIFGAPFVDGDALKRELDGYHLPGVEFSTATFRPTGSKFSGTECHGVRLAVTDRRLFDPFRSATAILLSLQKLYPRELAIEGNKSFFDQLAGTSRYRIMIQKQRPIGEILDAARGQVRAFEAASSDRFLYP
ncbi:MAG: DUF1343 domain-containing protein [Chlorobiaceae bacterium]|nr:DUF1343 domain-containing protein [Chlorobiaceae bacterium]